MECHTRVSFRLHQKKPVRKSPCRQARLDMHLASGRNMSNERLVEGPSRSSNLEKTRCSRHGRSHFPHYLRSVPTLEFADTFQGRATPSSEFVVGDPSRGVGAQLLYRRYHYPK